MYIQHQNWKETQTHISLKLDQTYWGAWKKFGWQIGMEGLSISLKAIEYAKEKGKKLQVIVKDNKYGTYEITPDKALENGQEFKTSTKVTLICIPRNIYKKLQKPVEDEYDFVDGRAILKT